MTNNIVKFYNVRTPADLLSIKEFAEKHSMKTKYLYKQCSLGKIKRYKRGVWKISESETLQMLENI